MEVINMSKTTVVRIIGDPPERRRKGKPKKREVIRVVYKPKAEVTRGSNPIPLSIHQKRKRAARAKVGGVSFKDIAARTLAHLPKIRRRS
jgi:hypothetical protein